MALPQIRSGLPWGNAVIGLINNAIAKILDASTTVAGLVRLATTTEATTGTATDIATTPAGVKAVVDARNAALASFLAHKNGTDQTSITSTTFVKITFGTESWDTGGYFASSTWTPAAGKYRISAQVTFTTANAVDGESLICALYKNGSAHRFRRVLRAGTDICATSIEVIVEANGTDTFEIYARKSGAGDGTVEGDTTETWFCGEAIA